MTAPERITVRLGEDFNWWLDSADESTPSLHPRGVLDPRQVAHLLETLEQYRPDGYRPEHFTRAFQAYRIDAEISEGVLRLTAVDTLDNDTFALPILGDDADGAYYDFLDAISATRIRNLNRTHHYARNCTQAEMDEELAALDTDRYFSDDTVHVFDEISEILEWSPAEWD
jgi:hypothetical protein